MTDERQEAEWCRPTDYEIDEWAANREARLRGVRGAGYIACPLCEGLRDEEGLREVIRDVIEPSFCLGGDDIPAAIDDIVAAVRERL
jgi:hypothetical protein